MVSKSGSRGSENSYLLNPPNPLCFGRRILNLYFTIIPATAVSASIKAVMNPPLKAENRIKSLSIGAHSIRN